MIAANIAAAGTERKNAPRMPVRSTVIGKLELREALAPLGVTITRGQVQSPAFSTDRLSSCRCQNGA